MRRIRLLLTLGNSSQPKDRQAGREHFKNRHNTAPIWKEEGGTKHQGVAEQRCNRSVAKVRNPDNMETITLPFLKWHEISRYP